MFSVWPKIQPKTIENDFSRYFHFKVFPPLSHTHESLTHALPLSSLHCSDPHTEPNGTIHTDAPQLQSRRSPELRRSTSITISRSRTREASIARSRSWSMSIGAVPVTGEIAIVVRRCGWFRRSEGLTAQWRLDRARGSCVWEREETIWSENNDWNQFQLFLADFLVKLKTFSVWPNFTAQPNARFSGNWFPKINFSQNKRSLIFKFYFSIP